MKHLTALLLGTLLLGLGACGSDPEPETTAATSTAATPAAPRPNDPTAQMAKAVGSGKPGAAVDIRRIDELSHAGRLPHLARLRARAATVELHTDDDFRAESPWNEFANGRRAASMRYWTTVTFAADTYDAYMRGAPDVEPFYAFGADTTVVAFDVPKVIRSPNVDGVQVLGWGAHSPQYPLGSRPDAVLPELLDRFGVPSHLRPIGIVGLGYRAADEEPSGSWMKERRRPLDEQLHRNGW